MGRVAIYKQTKEINHLEEKHYCLTRYQEEWFIEDNCKKEEKKAALRLGREV